MLINVVQKNPQKTFFNFLNPNWMHIACIAGEKTFKYFIKALKNGREEDV